MSKVKSVDYASEEFWKDAPDGATHWDDRSEVFCNADGYWDEVQYQDYEDQLGWGTNRYIPRPKPSPVFTQAMWESGVDPVIGMKCMVQGYAYKEHDLSWFEREVLGIYQGKVIAASCCEVNEVKLYSTFKPIDQRTNKEKAIDDMCHAMEVSNGSPKSVYKRYSTPVIEAIIAGKIHGVTFNNLAEK